MSRSKYTAAQQTLAIALYKANATPTQISELAGCSMTVFRQWLKGSGIPRRSGLGIRDPAAIERAVKIYKESSRAPASLRSETSSDRVYRCPDGCSCLLCQLKDPGSLGVSSTFGREIDLR